jgi:hypothetical protein
MRLTSTLTLRELTPLEASTPELLPPELRDFQFPYLIPDWCWVVEHNGLPVGLVVTSMAHGILFIWRVLATASAKKALYHILAAFPRILDNARKRGCVGYGCFLHDDKPLEAKIGRILLKAGATLEPWVGSISIAPMPGDENA